jgi:hypothetical protein
MDNGRKDDSKPNILKRISAAFFTYDDRAASGKTYAPAPASQRMKANDTPFEESVIKHLMGNLNREKTPVTVTASVVQFPMTDDQGRRVVATGHFLQYAGPRGKALITPGGEIITGPEQHMRKDMAPGMVRERGEFTSYSIPPENMTQPASNFSHFSFPGFPEVGSSSTGEKK